MADDSIFENAARAMKVTKMTNAIRVAVELVAPQADPDQVVGTVASFRDREWKQLEAFAKVNPASETTRELVIASLREWAKARTDASLAAKRGYEL